MSDAFLRLDGFFFLAFLASSILLFFSLLSQEVLPLTLLIPYAYTGILTPISTTVLRDGMAGYLVS